MSLQLLLLAANEVMYLIVAKCVRKLYDDSPKISVNAMQDAVVI